MSFAFSIRICHMVIYKENYINLSHILYIFLFTKKEEQKDRSSLQFINERRKTKKH